MAGFQSSITWAQAKVKSSISKPKLFQASWSHPPIVIPSNLFSGPLGWAAWGPFPDSKLRAPQNREVRGPTAVYISHTTAVYKFLPCTSILRAVCLARCSPTGPDRISDGMSECMWDKMPNRMSECIYKYICIYIYILYIYMCEREMKCLIVCQNRCQIRCQIQIECQNLCPEISHGNHTK